LRVGSQCHQQKSQPVRAVKFYFHPGTNRIACSEEVCSKIVKWRRL
jgi:hypothetical protein